MSRYEEASQTIQDKHTASRLSLDMGEPILMLDMAQNLIRLLVLEPGRDVPVERVGLKQGERRRRS